MDVYEKLTHPVASVVFVLTLCLPILIGFLTVRRTRTQSDFFVSAATIPLVSAISRGKEAQPASA